ncbi:urease accessory protein UreD [Methyloceanibacter sp.]|uniref:urease accessory protein UreD n=1 Tax=Methyloceanibacter sp. TaxID=1965321 RepID=UPI003D6D1063
MSGRLDLAFAADGDGRSYLQRQYAGYPFHVCRVHYYDREHPGLATLYVQSCSGGIYEHDRLDVTLATAQGAEAHVSTQAATVVHSMPSGSAAQRVRVQCEGGSYLEYLPDPQILFPGSRFRSVIAVTLGGDAVALVSDSFLCHDPAGRGEMFSAYFSEIAIEDDSGKSLAIDRLKMGGQAFSDSCPGISGRFKAQGTMIVAGLDLSANAVAGELRKIRLDGDVAIIGSSLLPNSAGLLVRVLAADGAALKLALHQVWCAARVQLKGSMPLERRK